MTYLNLLCVILFLLAFTTAEEPEDDFDEYFKSQLGGSVGYNKDYLLYAPDGRNFVKNVINVQDGMVSFKQGEGAQDAMTFDPRSGLVNFGVEIPPCRRGYLRTPVGTCTRFFEDANDDRRQFRSKPHTRYPPKRRSMIPDYENMDPCSYCKYFPCGKIVKCTHYVRV